MTITIHDNVLQGTDEWRELRRGKLTASDMHLVITAKQLKAANNDKSRGHVFKLLTERVTGTVEEDTYMSDAMLQGDFDESLARDLYRQERKPVEEVGFVTREFDDDQIGSFVIGYSPDGLVEPRGAIEVKSRNPRAQIETIIENAMPDDFAMQVHTGMLVADLEWCDFISYCGGLHMIVVRVWRNEDMDNAIIEAARTFYRRLHAEERRYHAALETNAGALYPTARKRHDELVGADVEE